MTRHIGVKHDSNDNSKKSYSLIGNDNNLNDKNYICDICGKNFRRKSSITIHVNSHNFKNKPEDKLKALDKENQNICNICYKKFTAKKNLLKHLRDVHKNYKEAESMVIKKLKCPERNCAYVGRLMKEIRNHIQESHKIKIFKDVLQFQSESAFQKWKKNEENNAVALFVTNRKKTTLSDGTKKQILYCHRSGHYSPKGFGKYRMRTVGSCKIGVTCPAAMEITEVPDGQINVDYYKTHLGHVQDIVHMKLTQEERAQLAEKIEQGFSLDAILEDVRESKDTKNAMTKRIHLLSKKDLYSIMRTINNNIGKKLRKEEDERKKQVESLPPKETEISQEGPLLLGNLESDKIDDTFQENFTFYPTQNVLLPQEMTDLDGQLSLDHFEKHQRNSVIPQTSGEGVTSQIVILSPDMNYGSVAEIILLSSTADQTSPKVTIFPPNGSMEHSESGKPEQPSVGAGASSMEEKNKANRSNLRLQIKEKIDRISEFLPDSESLTPKQFSQITSKLNGILEIFTEVSAKVKSRKQPAKKKAIKKVEYDGNWRKNGKETGRYPEAKERESVLDQQIYEPSLMYTVYN